MSYKKTLQTHGRPGQSFNCTYELFELTHTALQHPPNSPKHLNSKSKLNYYGAWKSTTSCVSLWYFIRHFIKSFLHSSKQSEVQQLIWEGSEKGVWKLKFYFKEKEIMSNHVLYQDTCFFQLHAYAAIYNITKLQLAASNAIFTAFQKLDSSPPHQVNRLCCCCWTATFGKSLILINLNASNTYSLLTAHSNWRSSSE